MRMTDIVSGLDLAIYPEVGLVIFLGVFVAVVVRTMVMTDRRSAERASRLPLEPDTRATPDGNGA